MIAGERYGRYIFTRDPFRIKPPNKTGIELPAFKMVKTSVVMKGKFNPDYLSVIIQFEENDDHFFKKDMNWMPKHDEIAEYLFFIFMVEPKTKQDILFKQFNEAMKLGRKVNFYNKDVESKSDCTSGICGENS